MPQKTHIRPFLLQFCLVLILAPVPVRLLSATGKARCRPVMAVTNNPPNIIIILSDDHGADDAGCFGNPDLKTPVIDQLAKEGMVFTAAYTPVSVCSPSRAALYTGLYPHRNGCHQNHGKINEGVKTLPGYLIPLGYTVALAGKKHVAPEDAFDFIYMERHEVPEFLKDTGEDPFCLVIAFNAPHQPYFNHKGGYRTVEGKPWLPDTEETRRYLAAYYDHVTLLDHEIGESLYWIEKYGFSDALQIYTSDHGPAFPYAKWTLYNQGIRVPFIIRWKGEIAPGTTRNALVSLVDVLPTLVQVAGGKVPEGVDGKSLVSLWEGKTDSLHKYLYAAYTNKGIRGASIYPIRAIRDASFKLIVNLKHENKFQVYRMAAHDERARTDSYSVLRSWQHGDSAAIRRAAQYWQRPETELYHLKADPYERHNLAEDPGYLPAKKRLLRELSGWMDRQKDPLSDALKTIM